MTHMLSYRHSRQLLTAVAFFLLGVLSRPTLTRIKAELLDRWAKTSHVQHAANVPTEDLLHSTQKSSGYLSAFRDQAVIEWPKNRTLTIVCHGHSVPAGYFKTPDVRTFDAYPHLLHVALKERFPFAVINIIVTAIGGEASDAGAARFERDVLSLHPDVVTIDYGLNDRRIGLQRARDAWVSMIEQAQRKNIPVILLTPTPDMSAQLSDASDPLNQHATQIRELAAQYHVGLVDSLAAFSNAIASGRQLSDLMSQVNHPNRQGHQLVADELSQWFLLPR